MESKKKKKLKPEKKTSMIWEGSPDHQQEVGLRDTLYRLKIPKFIKPLDLKLTLGCMINIFKNQL